MWLLSIFKAINHQPVYHQCQQTQKRGFKVYHYDGQSLCQLPVIFTKSIAISLN